MQSLRRDFVSIFAITALALACALALGRPFVKAGSATGQAAEQKQPPGETQKQSGTFAGTIEKRGDTYVLEDSSGATFGLDDQESARAYAGKVVKVTGQLDVKSKVIHVESITSGGD